jgi:ABC-type multidrug transport system ATPase subunit
MSGALLEFERVSFRYTAAGPRVIEDLDWTVAPGDRLGIIGANGEGKTTLIKLALGWVAACQGRVRLLGRPARWQEHYPRLGYIGHPSRNDGESGLPGDLPVGRLLDTYEALFAAAGREVSGARSLAAQLGVDDPALRSRPVRELSEGWRQRLLAYLALAKGPNLLLADEPTAGLDPEVCDLLLETVRERADTSGMALVWVTHRHDELALLGSQVWKMSGGRLHAAGTGSWDVRLAVGGRKQELSGVRSDGLVRRLAQVLGDGRVSEVRLEARRCDDDAARNHYGPARN